MLDRVVEIDDLLATGEVDLALVFESHGTVDQKDDFPGGAAAAAAGFLAQEQPEVLDRAESGNIGSGVMIANGVPVLIAFVLRKDAAQISLARFGRSVRLLAFASGQFFSAHWHPRAIAADVEDGCLAAFRQ